MHAVRQSISIHPVIDKAAEGIEQEGIEFWQRVSVEELSAGLSCPDCKSAQFSKEYGYS